MDKTTQTTQIGRVLRVIKKLEVFSAADVQSATKLPRKHCAACLTELKYRGIIRGTGRFVKNYDKSRPAQLLEKVKA